MNGCWCCSCNDPTSDTKAEYVQEATGSIILTLLTYAGTARSVIVPAAAQGGVAEERAVVSEGKSSIVLDAAAA